MAATRYASSLHILVAIAAAGEELLTSGELARQLDTNPVVVRRLIGPFKKAGLIHASRGAGGGIKLAMDASEITLGQIADIMDEDLGFHPHTISENLGEFEFLPHSILSVIEAQHKELHTAAITHMDGLTLKDLTQAATIRADLAALIAAGVPDEEIRTSYRIESGHLIPKS